MKDHLTLSVDNLVVAEPVEATEMVECRICQEEDNINNLESPCACTGSLKSYKGGYTALPRVHPDETTIDISGGWTITGTAFDFRDPRILAMAQNHIMEAEYDDYSATNASTTVFCHSAALVLMALLLLRHALMLTDKDEDDTSTMFSLFLLRAAGFLLPFYIMAWAINILQRRRQRQVRMS